MKNISKQFLLGVMSAGILFSSCKKSFLDINDNPNQPTDANMTAELIFPAAAEGAAAAVAGARASGAGARSSMQFAYNWVGYMSSNGDFARDNTETSYDLDFNFSNTLFLTRYNVLYDLKQVEVKGLATGDTAIAGAAIVLSAKLFQETVDLFGDIPYSEALVADAKPNPKYDNAQDIYNDLQARLDLAITYLKSPVLLAFKNADIVNKGDATAWTKLANTIKLRLLIRQSEKGVATAAEIAKIQANGGVLDIGETISANPGYVNEEDKQSPFYANYGYTATGNKATTGTSANEYIVGILSSTFDPRLEAFFAPIGNGSYVGNAYGLNAGDLAPGANTSYFGPGILKDPSQDQWLMPDFESLFLRAEAEARGWLPGGDAAAASTLRDAIRQSFVFLGFTTTDADDYITANAAIADFATVATSSDLDQAKFIAFQKYLANTNIDAQESYADIRRLNFLTDNSYISQHEGRVGPGTIPNRLLYPQSEYTTNADAVNAVGLTGRYQFTSKLFWQP
jgi:hypothetical protein